MRIRSIVTDEVFEAEWRPDHPESSYGRPVLVLADGRAVDDVWFVILDGEGEKDAGRN